MAPLLLLLFSSSAYAYVFQQVTGHEFIGTNDSLLHVDQLSTSSDSVELVPSYSKRQKLSFASITMKESGTMLPDSIYTFQEVVVTSARVTQTTFYSPSSVTVLSRDEIESMNAISLSQVVSQASGIFVKEYGATSGLKTISQRGLGTEHTLILLNGLRVSSMQNGLVDLGLISVDDIESVEIVRGGQSALYGADAVAGLINVISRSSTGPSSIRALSSIGSFGYSRYQVSGRFSSGVYGIQVGYGEERTDDDFPYQFRNGPMVSNLTRKNSDFFARHANVSGELGIGERTRLMMVASTYSSERGVGGAVVSPFSTSRARQTDTDHLLQTTFSTDPTRSISLVLAGQIHSAYERYLDPNLNIGGRVLNTYFRNDDIRVEPHVDVVVSDGMRFAAGTELVHTTASGNSLARSVTRKQLGAFFASEVVLMKTDGPVADVTVFPAVRGDMISSMSPTWSPQVGALATFGKFDFGSIRAIEPALRSSASRNFRMPTFNELYYNGGGGFGNPGLRPERSTSVDVGASVQFLFEGEHHMQATYFINDMNDRIVWVPAGGGSVVPRNLRRVRSEGFETSYRWNAVNKLLSLQANYTSSDSRKKSADYAGDPTTDKQLIYIPQETVSLSASCAVGFEGSILKELGAMMAYSFVGYRYYTEDNAEFLPSHQLVNVSARGRFALGTFVFLMKIEINNLFNEGYQVIPSYPMPMRSWRTTLEVQY